MAQARQAKNENRIVVLVVLGVIAVAVTFGMIYTLVIANPSTASKVPSIALEADGYGLVFNKDATPVIDVWEDPQCPACKAFETVTGEYLTSLAREGRAKVVFHTLSFIGPESVTAANAGGCAADEGKYLEFHKAIYDKQPKENSGEWTSDAMIALGAQVGITSENFKTCVKDQKYKSWTQTVARDGASKNVNQTPTLLFNNQPVDRNAYYSPQSLEAILKNLGMK